ncbi:secretin N-terminal domain-containing protein [Pseudoalteromonas sp. G4]|uniref:secretin N-terminal domain-containing protein n=1 Tax=Pseudoalteromonas sp. G4 TaxID=2992761 RepID=UPI00237EC4C6|nr:secretin N-terminal domain-containing protein [Pseudoalteromonas sp. G4]MDE3271237.1 type II secretory pathway protein [Pseudoalteromonas sp. G4]
MIKANTKSVIFCGLILSLNGCALINPGNSNKTEPLEVSPSFIKNDNKDEYIQDQIEGKSESEVESSFEVLAKSNQETAKLGLELAKEFDQKAKYKLAINAMPLNEFVHYAFGELLGVSYVVDSAVKSNKTSVTLEIKNDVSAQEVFKLSSQVLANNGVSIQRSEGVYFISPLPKKGMKSDKAFGFGRTEQSVPLSSGAISHTVPLKYKATNNIRAAVSSLVEAKVYLNEEDGLLTIDGNREQVLRALSLVEIFDSKLLYNKSVAIVGFKYIDSNTFINKSTELLRQDGISTNYDNLKSANVNFIPIEHLGQVVVFANSEEILERVRYWSIVIDKPATGSEQSFYIYHPQFARASDLGASLTPLINAKQRVNSVQTQSTGGTSAPLASQNQNTTPSTSSQSSLITGDKMNMVVDERANALIFHSTGKHYQELLPIIRKLDVMPKQVMMEVVIAEVNLTGSFSKGVEYAIRNGSAGNKTNTFSFDGEGGFSYSIVGLNGNFNINLNQTDGMINVLSRPTLVVRDGVSATINVGNDIPTVGATTSDPISGDRETTTIQYRKTGVDLSVTPTINAQGTVIMTISQNISNVSTSGPSLSGSPSVFERRISTEVVAGDGETVMLGGLISDNYNTSSNSIPLLGDIPVLGHMFRTDGSEQDKTELVVLVTPKIVKSSEDWKMITESFKKGLQNLKF